MRKTLLFVLSAIAGFSASAQTVAGFDSLSLAHTDTFYVNYNAFGTDVGFDDGAAHFPCVYDTSFGYTYWREGFAYSNMTDNTTPGFGNQYAAITGGGYDNSPNYSVAYGGLNKIILKPSAMGKPVKGFYITNSTYAYFSMRDGDGFAKKFGGVDGTDPDWFKLTVKGYSNGQLTTNSIKFFLADFRSQDDSKDTIVDSWRWVNLQPLGNVDSLQMELSSSDNGSFGMNTPAYFCIDNFTTPESPLGIHQPGAAIAARVYPNPATEQLFIELADRNIQTARIFDLSGKLIASYEMTGRKNSIPVSGLNSGAYILLLDNGAQKAAVRFVKQ
jgi:hypothetical protein